MKKNGKWIAISALFLALITVYELSYPQGVMLTDAIEAAVESEKSYIKWIDFTPTQEALSYAYMLDVGSYGTEHHLKMYELLAIYSTSTGGCYKQFKKSALDVIMEKYKKEGSIDKIATNERLLNYYMTAYKAVIGGFVGEYRTMNNDGTVNSEKKYGLRVFSPIAKNYAYSHYDDFGASRSYGYKRRHLGHDIMGSIGTPIIAVESGYVEACGWNAYGGWRIGIRSFDGRRYYYYAHLRKGHPYNDIYEGKIVNAGDVIGYLGMTGYSTREDTNNINTPHLHYGLQIIFDKSQKDGSNQIWVDMYEITRFLYVQRSGIRKIGNEYNSIVSFIYSESPD
jgi:murein DD-endopeptidase MepM/ murein hydrolase activator NlpD